MVQVDLRTFIDFLAIVTLLALFNISADKSAGAQLWFHKRPPEGTLDKLPTHMHLLSPFPPISMEVYTSGESPNAQPGVENQMSKAEGHV